MLPSDRPARRAVAGAIGTGAIAGAMLFGAAATAAAQPALPLPPCTAAELSFVMSGVNFDTANYLSTHPDVNNYFTTLKGKPKDQIPGSGPDLSRRQSASQGRHSAHPATGGRLPEPLWGSDDPITVSAARFMVARSFGRGRCCLWTSVSTAANLIWKIADLLRGPYQPN